MRGPLLTAGLIALAATACGEQAEREAGAAPVEAPRPDAVAGQPLPPRIYYNLMAYPWYERAEPLIYRDNPYMPSGMPAAIALAKLELAGNYQGVDFYVMRGDREPLDALYVPVFEGYWLPFAPQQ